MKTPVILLVDDDDMVRSSLRRTLARENYMLLEASDGESALKILRTSDVDLVLADQRMPGMDGIELLACVRREYPDVLTMMLTAHSDIEIALQAVNDIGVYKFFLKPCDSDELRTAIRHALHIRKTPRTREAQVQQARDEDAVRRQWEKECPGITEVRKDANGVCLLDAEDVEGMLSS